MPMAIPATNVNQAHLPIDPKDRHRYTPNQIQEYFKRANLTQTQRNSPILSNSSWQEAKTTPSHRFRPQPSTTFATSHPRTLSCTTPPTTPLPRH